MRIMVLITFILLIFSVSFAQEKQPQTRGEIVGQLIDSETGEPIPGATIMLAGMYGGAISDTDGVFIIEKLPYGQYSLQISHIGYSSKVITKINLSDNQKRSNLAIELKRKLQSLKGITVTPSSFSIMGEEPTVHQSLTRQEMATVPQLADDFFRAVNRLPGVTSNDFSARIKVRGGEYDEILVTLDGLQIYEPFHLKDIDGGAMSIIDVAAVDGIDLMTGAFPANYGNKMSGVFNIKSRRVDPKNKGFSVGVSLLNVRTLAEGTFANNKGTWLLSARRGYIDYVLKLADADNNLKPTYYDIFAKATYQLGKNYNLSTNFLYAEDNLKVIGEDDAIGDTLLTKYGNIYGWIGLNSTPFPKIANSTIISMGQVDHRREGQDFYNSFNSPKLKAYDKEDFRFSGLKTDWEYELSDNILIKTGFEYKKMKADYDYLSEIYNFIYQTTPDSAYYQISGIDTTQAILKKSGDKIGLFLSNRFRLNKRLTTEFGIRYDHTSYTKDDLTSPRINAVYDFNNKTSLRAGWGYFYQSEGIDEILVGDGEVDFFPAEKAEHWVLGLQHTFENGINLRLEGYYKNYSDLRPDPRNSFDNIQAFPELEDDRSIVYRDKSTSKGIELYLKKDNGGKFSWWLSYALAKVEDSIKYIYFTVEDLAAYNDVVLPSPNDQRRTFYLDLNYRPSHNWQLNLAWQFHSGWPFTDAYLVEQNIGTNNYQVYIQAGPQWSARQSNFSRVDVRANRYFRVGKGKITAFVELINIFNKKNVRAYEYDLIEYNGRFVLDKEAQLWFGILPSFGVNYQVNF